MAHERDATTTNASATDPAAPKGRAPSRKDRGRPWVLSVREDRATRLRILRAAAREGLSPSEWVRLRLAEALEAAEEGGRPSSFAGNGIGARPNSLSPVRDHGRNSSARRRASEDPS